jgi:hypothetical protein
MLVATLRPILRPYEFFVRKTRKSMALAENNLHFTRALSPRATPDEITGIG